ncbi:MAG: outer membrane beta-barrel protein [Desulfobulbaceae bacterium]|nr:outer membrane beta-barrel protein [Desulfobulbaceae bacterium]
MKKQGVCVAVFLAMYQIFAAGGDHRVLAAEEIIGAATQTSATSEASALSDPMARQAAEEAARQTGEAGSESAAEQMSDVLPHDAADAADTADSMREAMPSSDGDAAGDAMGQNSEGGDESLLPEDNLEDDEELFGMRRGVVHPYVAVGAEYTDNLYNLDKDRVDNLLITINPGIWISLPGKKQIPVTLAPNNASAGGYQYEMEDYERTDRFQIFLLGDLDYRMYSEDSNLNETMFRLQGFARYNFPAGLTLQILDAYTHNQDRFEIGHPNAHLTHIFDSNSIMGTIDWLITEKFQVTGDLSLFSIVYDEEEFNYLERDDLALDLHLFFHATDKTSFFLEYKYIDTQYDSNDPYDSTSDSYYIGATWDTTDKLSFLLRLGLRDKSYDDPQFKDWDGFVFELQSTYRLTEKSKLTGNIYRQNEETDMLAAEDKIMLGAALGYDLDITDKISFGIRGRYENADYRRRAGYSYYTDPDGDPEYNREDDRFIISPRLDYLFTEWLKAGIGYRYEERDSNIDIYDYYSNTIFIDAKVAL